MNGNTPNPFQPVIDVAVSGLIKIAVTLVLGGMIYAVVVFAVRLALRGQSSTIVREFRNLLAGAVAGLSMIYLFYLGFVVMEPVQSGVPFVIFGPFLMLEFAIAAVLGCVIVLLVFLGAGKTPQRGDDRRGRRRRIA